MTYILYLAGLIGIVLSALNESLLFGFLSTVVMIFSVVCSIRQQSAKSKEPYIWQPWEWGKTCDLATLNLKPPCLHCKHWKPSRKYFYASIPNGIRLCHTDTCMERDFSCFESKDI